MIFQVEIDRPSELRFSPAQYPSAAPVIKIYAGASGALSVTATLVAEKADRAVSAIIDRYTLEVTAGEDDLVGQTGDMMGRWFLRAHGLAQLPVNVRGFDAALNRAYLADPLPETAVGALTAAGTLSTGVWTTEVAAGALGAAVNRAAYYKVEYSIDPDYAGATDKGTQVFFHSQAGRVRVVKTRFETGLHHSELVSMIPQLSTVRPPNRDTFQSVIDGIDMISLVESYLPASAGWADQTIGEQWKGAHAWTVVAHLARLNLVPGVDAGDAQGMADDEFRRQAARIHWIDLDDDQAVDAAEVNYSADSRVGLTLSSGASTGADYTSGARYEPLLNDDFDR